MALETKKRKEKPLGPIKKGIRWQLEVMCVLKWKRKENMNESHVVSVTLCIWSRDVLKLFSVAFSSKRLMPKIMKWFKYRRKDTYSTSFNHCFSKLSSGWFPPPGPKGFSYLDCLPFFCSVSKILKIIIIYYLLIWLCWVLVAAWEIFSSEMWDLVPWPGIEPRPPALGAQSLSHWTTREVPVFIFRH